jgi:AAA15 family ATPase/GTPase
VVDIRSVHNNTHGVPVEFNFVAEESEGTKRAASLVGVMLACLKGGKALFVDELENSLHPLLVKELIRLFKDKRYNQEGSQLVFTTHNTDILDHSILRLGEVAIVRKTPAGGTLVQRLVDFKEDGLDVRNVTNFRKQYLDGFYSGIPHPAI